MRAVDIIIKKRNKEEIEFMVNGYTNGDIPEYQMAAFCMAIYFANMTDQEATYLTYAMLHSGDVLDLSKIEGVKVDKHSTGGVGDKTSLVVAPLVASLGVKVAKMSGRGLGHTGGTLDKLESIPGYNINLTEEEFINQVNNIGLAIVGQTKKLAPADKKLYSLRDVTGTVESIPLIASSIMSKKLAAGSDVIVLDVKVGSGAFMKNLEDARKLARLMCQIGKNLGKSMTAVLTNMDEPLGFAVGNSLEVIEAINTLNGNGPADFTNLRLEASIELLIEAKRCNSQDEALELLNQQIKNKKGLEALARMVRAQGGDDSYIYDPTKFEKSKYTFDVIIDKEGFVTKIDALAIGNAAMYLGAGREKITDDINHRVGIIIHKKVNDYVKPGDSIATLYSDTKDIDLVYKTVLEAYNISDTKGTNKLILDIIK